MLAPRCWPVLSIMAKGTFEGKDVHQPEIRRMFTLDYLLGSDWYRKRLVAKQKSDVTLWQRHLRYVDECLANHAQMWQDRSCRSRAAARSQWPNSNVQDPRLISRC